MTGRDTETEHLLSLCEGSLFSHKEELVAGIKSGLFELKDRHEGKVPAQSLIDVYTRRLKRISAKPGEHAEGLAKDIESFVENLRKNCDEQLDLWHVSVSESSAFTLFEGLSNRKILGCLATVDRRKVTEQEWQMLWNK